MDKDQNLNLKIENKEVAQFTGMARVQEFVRTVLSVIGMIVVIVILCVIGLLIYGAMSDDSTTTKTTQTNKSQPAVKKSQPSQPAYEPPPRAKIDLTGWRQLRKDMSQNDVRSLLGEPKHIQGGPFAIWSYSNSGSVTFYKDVVYSWQEPSE
jgi:hypothetical protein